MVIGLLKIVQVGAVFIVLLGATASVIIGNFVKCGKTLDLGSEQCTSFYKALGNTLFTPQVKIAEGIKLLQPENLNTIPDSVKGLYVNSIRADIFFSLLMSVIHLFLIYRILIFFPAFDDFFIKLFVIILAIGAWLSLQGFYASAVLNLSFLTPFAGMISLLSNLDLLFQVTVEQGTKVGAEIVSPV